MKKPNFLIVGAPKCGTTALSEYLRLHPHVFVCQPKEPYYFAQDFPNHQFVKTKSEYLSLFKNIQAQHLLIGEASAGYLYSSVAIKKIYEFEPNAKIIVMLRNPVDLIYSLHSQFVFDMDEDEEDFTKAWNLQRERMRGNNIPSMCRTPLFLQYKKVGLLGTQVEKLMSIFPAEQIKFILFDDFVSLTSSIYIEVLDFLNLPDDHRKEFPVVNPNTINSFPALKFIQAKYSRSKFRNLVTKFKNYLGVENLKIIQLVEKINTKPVQREELSLEFRQKLLSEFKPDILQLSSLIKRDLNHWLY